MKGAGVIEVLDQSSYGNIGTEDPWTALEGALPDTKGDKDLEIDPDKTPQPRPRPRPAVQTQNQNTPDDNEGDTEAPASTAQLSLPQALAVAFKEEGIDVGDIDPKASIKEFFAKARQVAIGDPEKLAEQYARKKGWTDELLETSKMLNSGKLTFPEQERYNKLSAYANFKYDPPEDDASEGEKDAFYANAKAIVRHMYEGQLKGTAQKQAIANIDEYSDAFPELVADGVAFAGELKEGIKQSILSKVDADDAADNTFQQQVKDVISKGNLFGSNVDKKITDAQLSAIYDDTEVVTFKDGTTETVSKYIKNLMDIKSDPVKAAKLLVLIAEGLDLQTPIEAGKGIFGNELEKQLRGAIQAKDQKVIPGRKSQLGSGILELLDSKQY